MKVYIFSKDSIWIYEYANFLWNQKFERAVFSKTEYMIGVGFKILARTPVPKLPASYPHPPRGLGTMCGVVNQFGLWFLSDFRPMEVYYVLRNDESSTI